MKSHEEGIILMIHIGIQHGILAEGLIAADQHNKQHSHAGKGKSQGQRPQLWFLQMLHLDSPDLKIAATAQIVSPNRQEIFLFLSGLSEKAEIPLPWVRQGKGINPCRQSRDPHRQSDCS